VISRIKALQRELELKTQQFIDTSLDFIAQKAGVEARTFALKEPSLPAEACELSNLFPNENGKDTSIYMSGSFMGTPGGSKSE